MESSLLRKLCENALVERLTSEKGPEIFGGYVKHPGDNLVSSVTIDLIQDDLNGGSGGELREKFRAAYSSSALAANTFGFFKRSDGRKNLSLFGAGFSNLQLEGKAHTGLDGTPPNLDVLITGNETVIGIESKCLEYISEKPAEFSPRYERIRSQFEPAWLEVYDVLKRNDRAFGHLDAAQLVKHYLGLRHTYPEKKKTLIYFYWEPQNASHFPTFLEHRKNVSEFADLVAKSEVVFRAQCYLDLWSGWERMSSDEEFRWHIENLKRRYCLSLTQ